MNKISIFIHKNELITEQRSNLIILIVLSAMCKKRSKWIVSIEERMIDFDGMNIKKYNFQYIFLFISNGK